MSEREPLAALVAAWRDAHEAALAVCHDVGRAKYHREALRLLAAVEAGTKCADVLHGLAMGSVVQIDHDASAFGCPVCDGLFDTGAIPEGFHIGHDPNCPVAAALALWDSVVAPASHGSPEPGR